MKSQNASLCAEDVLTTHAPLTEEEGINFAGDV
jgi:hypothetical protein